MGGLTMGNGPSLGNGAMGNLSLPHGMGIGAHQLLQQTMCQLLRPTSPRVIESPTTPTPHSIGGEGNRSPYWSNEGRNDLERTVPSSSPSLDHHKVGLLWDGRGLSPVLPLLGSSTAPPSGTPKSKQKLWRENWFVKYPANQNRSNWFHY